MERDSVVSSIQESIPHRKHIVCIGVVYVDTILNVSKFPAEDSKVRADKLVRRRGGNTGNTLEVLAQLIECYEGKTKDITQLHLLSVLPNKESSASDFVQASLPNVNVNGAAIFRSDQQDAASSYIIQSQETLSRTIVSVNQLTEMMTTEFIIKIKELASAHGGLKDAWFHFEGRIPEVTIQCVEYLRNTFPGAKISVECEKPERVGLITAARLADVVFYSKLWAMHYGYSNAEAFLQDQVEYNRKGAMLCCTWGAAGATAVHKEEYKDVWTSVKAWKPESEEENRVVDTIGAGDTFIAGILFAANSHTGWTVQQKLEFANECAGRKVLQEGFGRIGEKMKLLV